MKVLIDLVQAHRSYDFAELEAVNAAAVVK